MTVVPSKLVKVQKPALFALASLPLGGLVWNAFFGDLGANPVETITHTTGEWALRLLLVTLAVTPLRRFFGWQSLLRSRRMLGLFCFFYACMHLGTYAILDAGLDLDYILEDIIERKYMTAGAAAVLIMLPLALTSTNAMLKRLGGRNWRRLHRSVYAAGILGVLHYLWLVKADYTEPLLHAVVLAVLLLLRLPIVAEPLLKLRATRRQSGHA